MRVIGTAGSGKYLCEVGHTEIEKFMGLYYGNMKSLTVGSEVDLGKGYDFAAEVTSACSSMKKVVNDNARVVKALASGITFLGMVGYEPEGETTEAESA